VFYKKRNK